MAASVGMRQGDAARRGSGDLVADTSEPVVGAFRMVQKPSPGLHSSTGPRAKMGIASSRSPAMAYKDGSIWCSAFDDAGNRCWVNSQTGEKTYHLVGGRAVRRPSNTSVRRPSNTSMASPYAMQSPSRPWAGTTTPVPHSPGGPVMHSPGPAMHSPHHNNGATWVHPNSPHHGAVTMAHPHSPHHPGMAMSHPHSPGPAALATGYGGAPGYGTPMVAYQSPQPAYGAPPAADAGPVPTREGEAVGYRSSKYYVRPRSKMSWMWTEQR